MTETTPRPRRKSLFEKTQGPNAISVEVLIEKGNTVAQRVQADYPDFLREQIPIVDSLAKALFVGRSETNRQTFYMVVHDLRSSSASAGYDAVSAICHSLESLLVERNLDDTRMPAVIKLHLDALKLAMSGNALDGEVFARLIQDLDRATARLAPI